MTLNKESSARGKAAAPYGGVESLAGAFHPHAIEVQDFSHYALVIDVRARAEYENDHIPGAVRLEPPSLPSEPTETGLSDRVTSPVNQAHEQTRADELPPALAALVAPVKLDQAILIYCGLGGKLSQPLAKLLRWKGWTVDVLPGGWINYRRWVQAGLEVLPRLVAFRVIASSLGCEITRVLRALRTVGHQVLDVAALARWPHGGPGQDEHCQPSQAWFESQLLQELRSLDPRAPVWVGDVDRQVGEVVLPGAMVDALAIAPMATVHTKTAERVKRWREDEPELAVDLTSVLDSVAQSYPRTSPSEAQMHRWRQIAQDGITDRLLADILSAYLEPAHLQRASQCAAKRHLLPPLEVDSLEPSALVAAVRVWMPAPAQ